MESAAAPPSQSESAPGRGLLGWWHRTPLYLRILGGLVLGLLVGMALGERARILEVPSKLILRVLGALAPPLILIAVIHVLMTAELKGRVAARLVRLLLLNTLVAIGIGLFVANGVRPGRWAELPAPPPEAPRAGAKGLVDLVINFLDNIPRSLLGPLGDEGSVLGVIFLAVAFGIALRRVRRHEIRDVEGLVDVAYRTLLVVLHWVIELVPLGVFGIVASTVGTKGFAPFLALGAFIGAVLLALALQATYYLARIRLGSWARPGRVLRGTRDALVMAFSTASSTATMPVTYTCLREQVGLREESASMGSLVGANFNNDGTALYEAMAALFIAQMVGVSLPLGDQLVLVLTSIIASVGAAGIPEAGLVTMTLVFTAVGLPTTSIPLLLTVDWFLDRCRTAINVLGDINVSCLLDGRVPEATAAREPFVWDDASLLGNGAPRDEHPAAAEASAAPGDVSPP
ncbi:MAG TPA: dicarboxylate/amino acid:cation symporter [Isosphaeraceae bacterium]|jgi:DAACS family dicarboxylate/amino acid:cation (Na+ or H+) symporter